ncbi:MAG: DUF2162 domain-containing protein [Thermodesulfovibrionales bacterium]|nr:DUF2162 domain-containing protein [Thermodesulfovibrionales bacterium]
MDLNIVLWIGGMLFSLGIFAVKVGFGLGFSGMKWKGVLLTLSLYLMLFVAIAVLSGHLIKLLEPVLRKGPYLHALMAAGMIGWGIYLLRSQKTEDKAQTKFKIQDPQFNNPLPITHHSLLLLVPCPVCLSAMTFSTWAALNVIKLPAYIVGLGLGIVFVGLSLLFLGITRFKSSMSPRISLGLSMMCIGIYFMASLVLPAKIEEARGTYQSFLTEGANIDMNNSIGVFAILFVAFVIGYFANKKVEVKQ